MKGLAKYLPNYDWNPTFLTVELPGAPEEDFRIIQTSKPELVTERLKRLLGLNPNEGLQKQIGVPDQISTARTPLSSRITKIVEGWISYPDNERSWEPIAHKVLWDLLSRESFDVMISSSPPIITHLIARRVHDEFGIPWVADFRDLWTGNHYYAYGPIRRIFDKRLEIRTLAVTSALVTVSEPLCQSLRLLHMDKPAFSIPNGFDPDEIKNNDLHDRFSITYTGNLYLGKRDPELLFKVIRDLLEENKVQEDVVINIYGSRVFWVDDLIRKYKLEGIAIQHGFKSREDSFKEQRSSQVLLSLNWDNPKEEGVYTGKIFEYLAARRPILALGGPKGVISELLDETGTGIHLRNETELKDQILAYYREYQQQGYVSYHGNEKIHNYSHDKMAFKFSEVLNEVSQ
jgi:hypothetical protein